MKKASMNMSNARESEQLERMKKLAKKRKCFFCGKNYLELGAAPAIYETNNWYIKKNDYPYKGSVHHYLIVPKHHFTDLIQLSGDFWQDLKKSIKWLEKKLHVKGYSVFARSGEMSYTGATIDHLHFHFIVGAKKKHHKVEDNILITLGYKKK